MASEHDRPSVLDAIGRFLNVIRLEIEYRVIIPIIEGLMRLWFHLDPRVYVEQLRIRDVVQGNIAKKSDRFAVFVLYSKTTLPSFTTNLIDAVACTNLNLVVVANSELDALTKARLLDQCWLLVERCNLGRDFGAYKDAIGVLLREQNRIDRLILLNDSLFYFKRGLDDLIRRIDGGQDFIGVTEVFEFHYHVQSFALSFGPRVINNKRFRKFWRRYRPISTRRWSIHRGEIALTRCLVRSGFRPTILFQAAELRPRLAELPVRGILESIHLLPTFFRSRFYHEASIIIGREDEPEALAAIEAISEGVRRLDQGPANDTGPGALGSIGDHAEAMERWSFEILASKIVALLAGRNQIHVGGFLFMKYLGLPIIKRDIFYRDVYTLEDVYRILTELREPLRDDAMADLRRSGTAAHLNPFLKLLYRHGSI